MARTESQKLARTKYTGKTYEQINFPVKKGKREEYKQAAAVRSVGFYEMIRLSIEEYIQNHPVIDKGDD